MYEKKKKKHGASTGIEVWTGWFKAQASKATLGLKVSKASKKFNML